MKVFMSLSFQCSTYGHFLCSNIKIALSLRTCLTAIADNSNVMCYSVLCVTYNRHLEYFILMANNRHNYLCNSALAISFTENTSFSRKKMTNVPTINMQFPSICAMSETIETIQKHKKYCTACQCAGPSGSLQP